MFPLLGNITFRLTPRFSYTHTEILDISTGLLHPHRNSGYLHGSLTPTHKFWISPRVSYTHIEFLDISTGLLHPHKILDIFTGLLHPYRTFQILPRVSFTLIPGFSPEGINNPPFLLRLTHINYFSFPDLNYESSLDVVPKTNSTHTHPEW